MKQFRRKPHSGKSRAEQKYEHWLGEGIQGQETLLDDLDPTLYLADSAVSSLITSTALNSDRRDRRPQAILVPDQGTIGWHIGFLAKRFDVSVWTGDDDELISETAYRFNAKTFSGDLSEGGLDGVDLVLFSAYSWPDPAEFEAAVEEASGTLLESGQTVFILPIERRAGEAYVRWSASSATRLDTLTVPDDPGRPLPRTVELFWFSEFDPRDSEYLAGFLKRHREYFGKNIRDLMVDRLRSPEFQNSGTAFGAVVLAYSIESEE